MNNHPIFYVISHPSFPDWLSIGVTSNLKGRLSTYKTHVPDRNFKLEYFTTVDDVYALESFIKHLCESQGKTNGYEWVTADLGFIKGAISAYLYKETEISKDRFKYSLFSSGEFMGEFDYLKEISVELGIPYGKIRRVFHKLQVPEELSHLQIEKSNK